MSATLEGMDIRFTDKAARGEVRQAGAFVESKSHVYIHVYIYIFIERERDTIERYIDNVCVGICT